MRFFRKKIQLTGNQWIIKNHTGWGNRISWFYEFEDKRVYAHTTPQAKENDELLVDMQSGKIGRFVLKNVDRKTDPHDMWFADVEFIGYVGEPLENKKYKEK